MSCNYAESLSYYENKGKLGLPEKFEIEVVVEEKCQQLAELLKSSNHTVVHTGAGVSTAAGIPDFRGPKGVWTLEKQGEKPTLNVTWDDAKPTLTHMALFSLYKAGYISYIVTQNIDGLHLRSGIPRNCLASLHGNFFVDKCGKCNRQFIRQEAVRTVAQKTENVSCPGRGVNGRRCRGRLFDTVLDWEASLPDNDLELAHMHSCAADLSLCLGTTLQIIPSGNLPVLTKKRGGNLVICNLQPTKQDRHADLIINSYVDNILSRVLRILEVPLMEYNTALDPVLTTRNLLSNLNYPLIGTDKETSVPDLPEKFQPLEWTIQEEWLKDKTLVEISKRKVIKSAKKSHTPATKTGSRNSSNEINNGKKIKLDNGENELNSIDIKSKEENLVLSENPAVKTEQIDGAEMKETRHTAQNSHLNNGNISIKTKIENKVIQEKSEIEENKIQQLLNEHKVKDENSIIPLKNHSNSEYENKEKITNCDIETSSHKDSNNEVNPTSKINEVFPTSVNIGDHTDERIEQTCLENTSNKVLKEDIKNGLYKSLNDATT